MTHTTTEYIEGKLEAEHKRTGGYFKYWLIPFAHDLIAETRKEVMREVGEMMEGMKKKEWLQAI